MQWVIFKIHQMISSHSVCYINRSNHLQATVIWFENIRYIVHNVKVPFTSQYNYIYPKILIKMSHFQCNPNASRIITGTSLSKKLRTAFIMFQNYRYPTKTTQLKIMAIITWGKSRKSKSKDFWTYTWQEEQIYLIMN